MVTGELALAHVALDMQLVLSAAGQAETAVPDSRTIQVWLDAVFEGISGPLEVTVRVVDENESAELNKTYRHKQGPTNVLSFPFEKPAQVETPLLGDLVICAPVVAREADQQAKTTEAHWAHMIIHGCLHLLGYDHETPEQATEMEAREVSILQALGYANPYTIN